MLPEHGARGFVEVVWLAQLEIGDEASKEKRNMRFLLPPVFPAAWFRIASDTHTPAKCFVVGLIFPR